MIQKLIPMTYSVDEYAKLIGCSRNSAYEAAHRGDFPTIRIGRLIRVPRVAGDRLLQEGARTEDPGRARTR